MPRHDNIIQRALSLREHLWLTFIADGAHIPFFALANFLARAGENRAIIVTDAMAAAALGPGTYRLGEREVMVDENMIAHGPGGYLAGSATTMGRMIDNLRQRVGLSDEAIGRLTSANPRRAIAL